MIALDVGHVIRIGRQGAPDARIRKRLVDADVLFLIRLRCRTPANTG
jgi:hypothetical protein